MPRVAVKGLANFGRQEAKGMDLGKRYNFFVCLPHLFLDPWVAHQFLPGKSNPNILKVKTNFNKVRGEKRIWAISGFLQEHNELRPWASVSPLLPEQIVPRWLLLGSRVTLCLWLLLWPLGLTSESFNKVIFSCPMCPVVPRGVGGKGGQNH